jgi:MFS family permease
VRVCDRSVGAGAVALEYALFSPPAALRQPPPMNIYLILVLGALIFTSFIGSRVLMTLFAIELGASTAAIGVLIALFAFGPLLLSVYAGKACDRLGSFRPMVYGAAGIGCGLALPYAVPALPVLYLSAAVIGVGFVFFGLATQKLVSALGGVEMRTRNVSLHSLAIALSALAGPVLVGLSIDHLGHVETYLYLTLLVIVSCAGWLAVRRRLAHVGGGGQVSSTGGVRELLGEPRLRRTVVVSGLVVAGLDLYMFYMPIYGHSLGLTATMIGAVLSAHALAQFVVRLFLPALVRRLGEDRLMTLSLFLAGLTFLAFPLFGEVAFLMALSFALGLALGCGQPLSIIMTYNRAPEGRTGEALGLRFTVVNFTHMAIPLAFGTIGAALGVAGVFIANAALMFGGGGISARAARPGT